MSTWTPTGDHYPESWYQATVTPQADPDYTDVARVSNHIGTVLIRDRADAKTLINHGPPAHAEMGHIYLEWIEER